MVYRTTLPPLFTLRREMDRLFEDAFGAGTQGVNDTQWTPAADVREEAEQWRYEIELPGVAPEAVELSAEKGVLTVRGEKKGADAAAEGRRRIVERVQGAFRRSFQLPQSVAEDRISATFAHGVLTVIVPKVEQPKARRIDIRS